MPTQPICRLGKMNNTGGYKLLHQTYGPYIQLDFMALTSIKQGLVQIAHGRTITSRTRNTNNETIDQDIGVNMEEYDTNFLKKN